MFTIFEKSLPKNSHTDKLLVNIRKSAEDFKDKEIKDLTFSKFRDFFETGKRVSYEDEYIEHRKRLNAFLFLCLNGEDYISELEDSIWAVCNEFTWSLPAHLRGKTVSEMSCVIDLFSAETAFTLSELLSLTEDIINPTVAERIRFEVKRRIIQPYLNGETKIPCIKNNWDAVCGCGVGASVLYLCDKKDAEKVIPDVINSMNSFLESYDEDGCCKEGPLYWEYGFGYFCYCADLLYKYTDGKINLFSSEKVHNIALYRQKIVLDKDDVIPFSDASHNFTFYAGLSDYLAVVYDDVISVPLDSETLFEYDYRYRTAAMLRSFYWYDASVKRGSASCGRYTFDTAMQYIFRNDKFVLAVKGGNNSEPHNHNDLGSFVLYTAEDGFVFDDPGWPDYDGTYFSGERYKNICASSKGHSTLMIDGKEQLFGENIKTEVLRAGESFVKMDLSSAYGVKAVRSFEIKDNTVIISDIVDTDLPVIQRFVTRIKPEVCDDGIITVGKAKINVQGSTFDMIKTDTFRPRLNICRCDMKENETLHIIDFSIDIPKNGAKVIISL